MNDFIYALKDDLLDRRLLPLAALVAVALLGALAYVVLGGSSETANTAALAHPTPVTLRSGVAISSATAEHVLAETTSGGSEQRQGASRNPFAPLPGALVASTSSSSSGSTSSGKSSSSGSSSSSTSGTTGSGSGSGGSAPSKPSSPSKSSPAAKTVYDVNVLFGEIPAGASGAGANLAAHDDLKLLTPLPSRSEPLVVFRGVKKGGKSATFTVAGEAILSGNGACKPSAAQCETISLSAGQTEELQYLPAGATQMLRYELRIVRISSAAASAAAVASLWRGESVAGLEVLRSGNLLALPGLRSSAVAGVLVPVS